MVIRRVVRSAAVAVALVCSGVICHGDESRTAVSARKLAGFPNTMLWAWHRPEDLRGLDRQKVGVAFLAATWFLGPDGPRIEPRVQPLLVDPGTQLMAVVRIEVVVRPLPAYDDRQVRSMAASLAEVVERSRAAGLQIDYDATSSSTCPIDNCCRRRARSATGRCNDRLVVVVRGDELLLGAPVDEVVPMSFQLGVQGPRA